MADLVIWKFPVAIAPRFSISMPTGAQILSIQVQRDRPQMWVLVNPKVRPEQRHFRVVGTGHEYPVEFFSSHRYLDTFQEQSGRLVLHVFEDIRQTEQGQVAPTDYPYQSVE